MSETGEMPQGVEVEKNPVVEGTRAAVRKALEANQGYQEWRKNLAVQKGLFAVYRTWDEARKHVVGAMTERDRRSWSTKMYELKMKMVGSGFWAADFALNVVSKAMIIGGTGFIAASPFVPGVGLFGAALGGSMLVTGAVTEIARRGASYFGEASAASHVVNKVGRYKVREAGAAAARSPELAGKIVKNILTGFAYPEGKPMKPPMAKI
ncbi:hypothetical protein HY411_03125 [Candidatus Gottesmanbacteria bacterium]|nr:hypothetical protein [Candidatus Gottesmanbacteria bacterium]